MVHDPVLVCRHGECPANQGKVWGHAQKTGQSLGKLVLHGQFLVCSVLPVS